MSEHELRHIAIGYDESVSYDFDDEEGVDEGILDNSSEVIAEMDGFLQELLRHAGEHRACLMVIREFPPSGVGVISRMIFDLGLAMYLGKPLVIVYRSGVEIPPHLRVLAKHCISFEGDDPLASSTVQAVMERYA